jgi:hypothetical protein
LQIGYITPPVGLSLFIASGGFHRPVIDVLLLGVVSARRGREGVGGVGAEPQYGEVRQRACRVSEGSHD